MGKMTSKDSSRDLGDSDTNKDGGKKGDCNRPKDSLPILKYIKTQVS